MAINKPRLILLVGPPASGKTTWANAYRMMHSNTLIVGRDKLREMLYGYSEATVHHYYLHEEFKKREKEVTEVQQSLIRDALASGKTIIVDDTNCDIKRIKKFSRDYDRYAFQYVLMSATLEQCLNRNKARMRQIEEDVIKKMYAQYETITRNPPPLERTGPLYAYTYQPDPSKPSTYLFDLDGTMANLEHRHALGSSNEEILLDKPIEPVVDFARIVGCQGYSLVFLSGREFKLYESTHTWLKLHLPAGQDFRLLMRPDGDFRKDSIVKRELFRVHVADFYNVKGVFDDRKQVKQMWVDMGLFVFDVNQHDLWF